MSDDILSRATHALRDGADGVDGERNGRPTLTRVLRTVQRSRGRRRVMWIVGLQLAFGGVAVGAWAVRSGGVAALKRRFVSDDVPARSAPLASIADRRPALAPPASATDESGTPIAAAAPPPVASAARRAAQVPPPPAAQRRQSARDRRRIEVSPPAAAPIPPALTAGELYERAHQAHFVRRDFGAALELWNRYIELGGAAPLVAEARFNRAIALLQLGRPAAAVADLRPFADGDYGAYRREEARTLLRRIAEQP